MNWHLFIDLESINIYSKFIKLGKENIPWFYSARAVSVFRKPIQGQASFCRSVFHYDLSSLLDCSLVSSTVLQVQVMCAPQFAVSFVTLQWTGSSVGAWAGGCCLQALGLQSSVLLPLSKRSAVELSLFHFTGECRNNINFLFPKGCLNYSFFAI